TSSEASCSSAAAPVLFFSCCTATRNCMPPLSINSEVLLSACRVFCRSSSDCADMTTNGFVASLGLRCASAAVVASKHTATPVVNRERIMSTLRLFSTRFQSTAALIKAGLHRHDTKLTILNLTMRGHHPHEIDCVAGHRHVRMKTFRHGYRIAVAHDADELRLIRIRVDKLHAE